MVFLNIKQWNRNGCSEIAGNLYPHFKTCLCHFFSKNMLIKFLQQNRWEVAPKLFIHNNHIQTCFENTG